jgi:hypothetical protein
MMLKKDFPKVKILRLTGGSSKEGLFIQLLTAGLFLKVNNFMLFELDNDSKSAAHTGC